MALQWFKKPADSVVVTALFLAVGGGIAAITDDVEGSGDLVLALDHLRDLFFHGHQH